MQPNDRQLMGVEIGVMVCKSILPMCLLPVCIRCICNKKLKQNWSLTLCYI